VIIFIGSFNLHEGCFERIVDFLIYSLINDNIIKFKIIKSNIKLLFYKIFLIIY